MALDHDPGGPNAHADEHGRTAVAAEDVHLTEVYFALAFSTQCRLPRMKFFVHALRHVTVRNEVVELQVSDKARHGTRR